MKVRGFIAITVAGAITLAEVGMADGKLTFMDAPHTHVELPASSTVDLTAPIAASGNVVSATAGSSFESLRAVSSLAPI